MIYSIIPEINALDMYVSVSREYNVNWEYNDFTSPKVYDDLGEIEKIIDKYIKTGRDFSKDTMHGAFLGLDIAAKDPVMKERSRALMRQSVEIAEKLSVKGVVFHTGLIGGLRLDYYINNWLDEMSGFMKDLALAHPDIVLYLENSFEQEPDAMVRFMEECRDIPNIKLCLDYGHAVLTSTPIEDWVKAFAPYIGHMHINDNDLRDDLHLIPGTGKIDFNKWKQLMEKYNIDVSVLLELRGIENQKKALEYMKSLL